MESNSQADLRNMVMAFRVTELQNLLGIFGKNKNGRKNELQARAMELLMNTRDPKVASKIHELYRSIQISLNQPLPASAAVTHNHQQQQQYPNPAAVISTARMYSGINVQPDRTNNSLLFQQNRPGYYNGAPQLPGLQIISASRPPLCPDVRFRRLPFYDTLGELIRPTSLLNTCMARVQDATFSFCLTPQQAKDIAASKEFNTMVFNESKVQFITQVQIRLCAFEKNVIQDDHFPPSFSIKVNQRSVILPQPIPSNRPGVEPKRPSKPLNVTNYVKVSPYTTNNVQVTWVNDMSGKDFVISINLVKKLGSADLLSRLKGKGARPADFTKGMIKELVMKDDTDCIATTSFKVSVSCPLGKCRMNLPCRASSCKHLQCFDGYLFVQMNEKKPVWSCPVCDKFIEFDDISIDGYFEQVIADLKFKKSDTNDIEVLPDGSWRPLQEIKKDKDFDEPPAKRTRKSTIMNEPFSVDDDEVLILSDDDDTKIIVLTSKVEPTTTTNTTPKPPQPIELIDLALSSDSEDVTPIKHVKKPQSSTDSSDDEVIKPRSLRKRPCFIIDETSSSSSEQSNATPEILTPTIDEVDRLKCLESPDLIILDSPNLSPRPPSRPSESVEVEDNPISKLAATSTLAATATNAVNPTDNVLGSFDINPTQFGGSMSLGGPTGIVCSQNLLPPVTSMSGTETFPPNPFLQYDRTSWDPLNLPSTSDFSALDYPSMDYFNQGPSTGFPGGRGGNNFLPRW